MDQVQFGAAASLAGVIIGSSLTWVRESLSGWRTRARQARYLAIRVVCILDKYVEKCAEVVADDGLSYGQRDKDGYLDAQVPTPPPLDFPNDLNWMSIDHTLMYRLLSMPNEAGAANDKIASISEYVATPPDFEEFFEERQDQYARLGLAAFAITQELRQRYGIPLQEFGNWNPVERLKKAQEEVKETRRKRNQLIAASSPLIG